MNWAVNWAAKGDQWVWKFKGTLGPGEIFHFLSMEIKLKAFFCHAWLVF